MSKHKPHKRNLTPQKSVEEVYHETVRKEFYDNLTNAVTIAKDAFPDQMDSYDPQTGKIK